MTNMEKISLSTALKVKKRFVSDLKSYKEKILENNSNLKQNKPLYNIEDLFIEYNDLKEKIISLKCKIRKANISIIEPLVKIEEEKDRLVMYKVLREKTKEGFQKSGGYGESEVLEYKAQMSKTEIDKLITNTQKSIFLVQEIIDKHNASVLIEI